MKLKVTFLLVTVVILGIAIDKYECKMVGFTFGDSLSDVGNNNRLPRSLAKPNLPWYGVDFGNGLPNGRFTNGRIILDVVGDAIGMPRPPPFLDPTLDANTIMEKGVNYASGGGGILNETGRHFIQRFCFDKQIELFKGTQDMITRKIGKNKSDEFFQNALYFIAFGNNDFINNYLMPVYNDHWMFNDETFVKYLVHTYEKQFKTLHNLGARKMFVFGLGPVGCIPMQRVMTETGDCQERTNNLARNFNYAVGKMIEKLSKTLPNANFKFADTYDFLYDLVSTPSKYGFTNSDSPCCSFGEIRPAFTCIPASILCQDRTKYVFWDEYHPTDSASEVIAKEFLKKFGLSKANQAGDAPKSQVPAMAPAADGTQVHN